MPITVFSPYNSKPVVVRDADVGRAVRDQGGKVFYVLQTSDGKSHYGSPTRNSSPEYESLAAKLAQQASDQPNAVADEAPVAHDARGKRRSTSRIRIGLLLVLLIIVVVTYLFTIGPFGKLQWRWPVSDTTPALSDSPTAPDGADPQAGE